MSKERKIAFILLIITIILFIIALGYTMIYWRQILGLSQPIYMKCSIDESKIIKEILLDKYKDKEHQINSILKKDDLRIKMVRSRMDFNNREYKLYYTSERKRNEYVFHNDSLEQLHRYIDENKISINYSGRCIGLWMVFCLLAIVTPIYSFYKVKPEVEE